MTELQPATRALEEMLKCSRSFAKKTEKQRTPPASELPPNTLEQLFHTVVIPDEDSLDFPIIEWSDEDDDTVKTEDCSHFQHRYPRRNTNEIPINEPPRKQCKSAAPCLVRCRTIFANLQILGSKGMEDMPSYA